MEKTLANEAPSVPALRQLPAVDKIVQHASLHTARARLSAELLTACARRAVADLRREWLQAAPAQMDEARALELAVERTAAQVALLFTPRLRRVVNATGIILHTGLGRAVLSAPALQALPEVLAGYCNLEIDLASGRRGDRHQHVEHLLCALTSAEAACVVNNNAAAVLLTLNTIATRKQVLLSRGQMVEIGGSFRMPEVVKKSGAQLIEVGTTNKTRLQDYAGAISPRTAAILVAHPSNYRILGFTHEVELRALVELARQHNLVLVHDLGGGILADLRTWGLPHEPVVSDSMRAGVHLATFSGDKMLGGPQCGLIVGERSLVERIKKNPLMRALRCDKLTLTLLESTLRLFLHPESLPQRHRVIGMMTEDLSLVRQRAQQLHDGILAVCGGRFTLELRQTESEAGSGALPIEKIPSYAVTIRSREWSAAKLAKALRQGATAVVGYVRDDRVWLDVRTIQPEELEMIINNFRELDPGEPGGEAITVS
ncbi:MAG: L-seryl-tRNA(Sec) selenium transferase [candidate division KSB1 bacterium]|nr:L-seryl-tRNA(Sec) selenium transferase [candidate division KSB1 bacterium]MDZ7408714.1 L-seryl-tRNA(Sec) selenium transferase [candidate division KSB1 bacterium]